MTQRSRRAGTAPIKRHANPAGVAIPDSGKWKISESDSPQPVASEAEIDALEYVVHQGIIGAYDRPVLLAWLARLQRTPAEPSAPGEGTRQAECTLTDAEREAVERARQTLDAVQDLAPTATADDAMAAATLRGLLERTKG